MTVNVTLDLPPDIEERLRAESVDLSDAVRESLALDLFRRGLLKHCELGQVLGLDRFKTDAFLKQHRVTEWTLTHEELDADLRGAREVLGMPEP
jgi:hypothetical protein